MRVYSSSTKFVGTLPLRERLVTGIRLSLITASVLQVSLLLACAESPLPSGTPVPSMSSTKQRLTASMANYQGIQNYQQCVAAGFPSLRSMPPQCVLPDGRRFVKAGGLKTCTDKCGDGTCEEVVCMALGCPCSETKESCPQDCK